MRLHAPFALNTRLQGFEKVKKELFGRLHDIARTQIFPNRMPPVAAPQPQAPPTLPSPAAGQPALTAPKGSSEASQERSK